MNYTKAGMLAYLKENLPKLNILPIHIVRSSEFFLHEEDVIQYIIKFAKNKNLVVRSSSSMEDLEAYSNAGKFESLLNIAPKYDAIKTAIEEVYHSYETNQDEEILIQPMLTNIVKSGVCFTSDMETFAPYYVVNYSESTDTAAVTGGHGDALKTYVKYKFAGDVGQNIEMDKLFSICKEIETFLNNSALDIEFAIDTNQTIYILQVRPIARGSKKMYAAVDLTADLERIYKKIKKLSKRHPFLLGETTCFGVMPDWNPAEILGVRPKKLAISLYKELVTDNIWAQQRYDYGYRDLTMHPLMISLCGVPYIDTRITFNSFIPKKLNERIAEKLVNYYLQKLSKYPKYHDKIEFEIVYSCYYFGLRDKLKILLGYGFNQNEITRIEFSLLELTNNIINPVTGLYLKDMKKVALLEENYEKIVNSEISLIDKIYWLIEECKAYGTLPFAGVARAAFIAVQFLKSFVETGIITKQEYDIFMNSLDTVNKKMNVDLNLHRTGKMTREEFLNKYGHIRPGTYDILSKRYDEAFEEYFDETTLSMSKKDGEEIFTRDKKELIQLAIEENGIQVTADELLNFIKLSIEGREQLKFVFTKAVSKILQLIGELGERTGLSKEEMAYIDISRVKQLYTDLHTGSIIGCLKDNIRENKEQYQSAILLKLPSLIVKPEEVYSFYLLEEEPNFITQKSVTAEMVLVDKSDKVLEGKIVFIQTADPGYDYLFSKNIKGLVTQFGGANSHMAIRCAELGIPAVIGVGEKNFREWSSSNRLMLDCQKQQVILL